VRIEPKRHRIAEKITWDKHVVAAGWFAWDAGSTPAASTIFYNGFVGVLDFWRQIGQRFLVKSKPIKVTRGNVTVKIYTVQNTVNGIPYYSVFNLAQIDHLDTSSAPATPSEPPTPAEKIIAHMPNCPPIKHGFRACCYCPNTDEINMANPSTFAASADYFSTIYHEMTHATGHKSRLGRLENKKFSFGSEDYSREELVAEIGAAFLCGEAGIFDRTANNSAAYLNGWLDALKRDTSLVLTAAAQAQKATDYILNRKPVITE
jgi:antirestriction protein ArdC